MFQPERHATKDTLADDFFSLAQHILVVVFGLLPIFFVPIAAAPFNYSKVLFVLIGIFVALILFGFAILRRGSLSFRLAIAPALLWIAALIAFVSAFLSGDFRDALIGEAFTVHTALFVALLALAATMWAMLGASKVAVMRLFILFAFSTLVLSVFHVLRLVFGVEFLSFGLFAGDATLSPFGGWNDLAIFFGLAIVLALVAIEQLPLTKAGQGLFACVVAAALIMLSVINFFAVWVVLGLISFVMLVYGLTKDRNDRSKRATSRVAVGISLAVLAASVVFVIGGSTVGNLVSQFTDVSYVEVRPSFAATVDVTRSIYNDDVLFGIGPNRFADAWRLYKDAEINQSIFWDTDFSAGFGYLPTFFATTGVLGGLALLAFLCVFAFTGVRMLLKAESPDPTWYFIGTTAFIGGLYIWIMTIIYVPGPALLLLAAACTGLVAVASNTLMHTPQLYELNRQSNRRIGFVFVISFLVLSIGSVSALYFVGRHYAGAYVFNDSFVQIAAGATLEEVEAQTILAYTLSPDDAYARQLAEYQLVRMGNLLSLEEPTEEDQQTFNTALSAGVNAANVAIGSDTTDPRNWNMLGSIYALLAQSQFEGAYERAVEAFERARAYDPENPSYALTLAQLAYTTEHTEEARGYVEQALEKKQNYSDAIFFIAQMDIAEGNVESALEAARAVTVLEPQNPVRFFQLGLLHFSQQQFSEAVSAFSRAIALNPDYANARYYRALAYDTVGNTEGARADLEVIAASNPDNELIATLLARLERGEPLLDTSGLSEPVADSEVAQDGDSVTTSTSPDTPLVSPVNVVDEEETAQ